ncbi:hypothetical protein [Mycobacterium sp.]|uniref:hypothetical protein n=1 Tax=Mycobacterium sp. TaxID=1785 RepID=UPI002CF2F299|nr:hypothetical protein [Mycobacterium sp.]HKP42123.1 hypothetical protein [Mycobacterium sp.]
MHPQTEASEGQWRFRGDRYERFSQGGKILADDPAIIDAQYPFDYCGLQEFIAAVVERRIFDDLSERDSDRAAAMLLIDFPMGPTQLVWRIHDSLSVPRRGNGYADDIWAFVAVLVAALTIAIEQIATVHRMAKARDGQGVAGSLEL